MSFEMVKQDFRNNGYEECDASNSGQCTGIFKKNGIIYRLGICERYHVFAKLVLDNILPKEQVVDIYTHELPEGIIGGANSTGYEYTLTTMQILDELSTDEQFKYEAWIKEVMEMIYNGTPIDELKDEFNLLESIVILNKYAKENNFSLDFMQAKNIMKNGSKYVHIDPFG